MKAPPVSGAFILRNLFPKLRLQVQLVHALNQAADVVAKDFAQRLVDLRRAGLTPKRVTELRLNHVESGFHVGTLVVVLHEAFRVVGVEVEHLLE